MAAQHRPTSGSRAQVQTPDIMCLISANPIGESVNTHQLSGLEVYSLRREEETT